MKGLIKLILTGLLTILISPFFQFWWVAVAVVLLNVVFRTKGINSFLSGFLGVGMVWGVYAYIQASGDSQLINEKMAELLMGLPDSLMFLVVGLIGGLTGGLSAIAGHSLTKKKKKNLMSSNPYH